jgi:hypothetical protein
VSIEPRAVEAQERAWQVPIAADDADAPKTQRPEEGRRESGIFARILRVSLEQKRPLRYSFGHELARKRVGLHGARPAAAATRDDIRRKALAVRLRRTRYPSRCWRQ